jgi:3-deoxy-7-phosphoheptulonate synthase
MTQIHDLNIQRIQPLPSPLDYLEKLPISSDITKLVSEGRNQISNILKGRDERLLIIAGPCSIHDIEAGYEYAKKFKELSDSVSDKILMVMRVYFEKPRTTVGWKGLIYDPQLNGSCDITTGLQLAREFLIKIGELGILSAIEFVDPITPQYIADLISWAAIGARTSESQTHRQMSSGLSMPIGFKNGTGGSIQLAADATVAAGTPQAFIGVDYNGKASVVVTNGNPDCHIVLRGGSNGPNYDAESVAQAISILNNSKVETRLIVDCSHANCNKDYKLQRVAFKDLINQRSAGNKNIVGIMLESHLEEGNQKLDESNPSNLKYGISITDPCVGWEETVELVTEAYRTL